MSRIEYPRPNFVRENWKNLNGQWEFEFDDANEGIKQKWYNGNAKFSKEINVPFVYESELSGINDQEIHDVVWYKKSINYNKPVNNRVLIHFEAVDYESDIFINGQLLKNHIGGHTPITIDITDFLGEKEEQLIVVRVYDPKEDESIPRGKQFWEKEPHSIWYTNSTGIWGDVWLEEVSPIYIEEIKFTPKFDEGKVNIELSLNEFEANSNIDFEITFGETFVAKGNICLYNKKINFDVDLFQEKIFRGNFHGNGWTWTPKEPNLFDIVFTLNCQNNKEADVVKSYFGMRKVHVENGKVYLNNKPFYQKLVLDQGYWKEGLLTAPSDEDYRTDILLAKEMGFNGCRKHQKMESPKFLYWADRLGYIVWGECAAPPIFNEKSVERLFMEWMEVVKRDYNHPSIITWVPINESWGVPHIHSDKKQQSFSQSIYHFLHSIDDTRLVISNDGWDMTTTDICAIHNYNHGEKTEILKYEKYKKVLKTKEELINNPPTAWSIYAQGFNHKDETPILLTEFGGIAFEASLQKGWGYTSVSSEEEFLEEYERIMDAIYSSEALWGYCYTQLCDVEQEINGMLTYERKPKCSLKKIKEINDKFNY